MKNITEIDGRLLPGGDDIVPEPIIIRVNKFTEQSAKDFARQMSDAHHTGQPVIPVVIDSYGGDIYALMSMISEIKNSELPVATIVESKAMSCGAELFCFGTDGYRFIEKNAVLMIHDAIGYTEGKLGDIKSNANQLDKLNKKLAEMMAENCGKPKDYFYNLMHEGGHSDLYFDSKEAVKHGMANHIRVPKLITRVKISIDLE